RLQRSAVAGARVLIQVSLDDVDNPLPQSGNRREFAHVDGRQPFRQPYFIAPRERPVSEIVGETLPNEVVLLQRTKGVLENGRIRAGAQCIQELRQRGRLLALDAQQVSGGVEIKGR